jgi:hypothetical protein
LTATPRTRKEFLSRQSLFRLRGRTIGALRAERHTLTSAEWTSCSACHELLCSRAFLFIVLRSAQHPQIPRFLQIFRGIWPMPLSLLNHSALALFVQRTRIPTSARSTGFCAIWVCISSSSSSKCTNERPALGRIAAGHPCKLQPSMSFVAGRRQDGVSCCGNSGPRV